MQRILRAFTSLSTRLLLLTLLWVSFIVVSVGYTMLLNWELEASAFSRMTTRRAPICEARSTPSTSR